LAAGSSDAAAAAPSAAATAAPPELEPAATPKSAAVLARVKSKSAMVVTSRRARRTRSPALIHSAITEVGLGFGQPPDPGRSPQPRHHISPLYEGGAPPSSANSSFSRTRRWSAACSHCGSVGACPPLPNAASCHAGMAFSQAMRRVLCSSPAMTRLR